MGLFALSLLHSLLVSVWANGSIAAETQAGEEFAEENSASLKY